MSKRANYTTYRRRIRRREKAITECSPTKDKMAGRACRRGWGAGLSLNDGEEQHRERYM